MDSLPIERLQEIVALDRDEHAYKLIFLHFYNGLTRFAMGILKNREASEEVVSDVMMKVWSKKEDLLLVNNLKVYLYQATKNTALNYLRSNSPGKRNLDIALELCTNEDVVLDNELRKEVTKAVKELPPRCQMVYKLVRENGFSYKEVAAILEISENTVDRHLNNALHKLIKAMKRLYGYDAPGSQKNNTYAIGSKNEKIVW